MRRKSIADPGRSSTQYPITIESDDDRPLRSARRISGPSSSQVNPPRDCSHPRTTAPTPQSRIDVPHQAQGPPQTSRTRPSTRDWHLDDIVGKGRRFCEVPRVSILESERLKNALNKFELNGVPLIIEDVHKHPEWSRELFSVQWLRAHYGDELIPTRNIHNCYDQQIKLSDFLDHCDTRPVYSSPEEMERLYGKDISCPQGWHDWLFKSNHLPSSILPCNDGDLLQHLPASGSVEHIMCYFGVGDTFTPCHKDLCSSSGHNLMVYSEQNDSSFWFMTASNDAAEVSRYFQSELGQELDWENHVATVDEFAAAPFCVYIAEQKIGDLVLVPPRSCHQVVNNGGLTMKVSWSRMTIQGLETALYYELPSYRRVCRPELYRVKSVIYRSLVHHMNQLEKMSKRQPTTIHLLRRLIPLFDDVLREEFAQRHGNIKHIISNESASDMESQCNISCDFCGADIFQSFFECHACSPVDPDGDSLVICPSCYVEGRSCACGEMEPVQCRSFTSLLNHRNQAADILTSTSGGGAAVQNVPRRLTEDHINTSVLCLFEAACILHDERAENSGGERTCLNDRRELHKVPRPASVHCRVCRVLSCYKHLLSSGLHSSEVLLDRHRKGNEAFQAGWHQQHRNAKNEWPRIQSQTEKAERDGTPVASPHTLALLAKRLPRCRPLRPELVMPGWYDEVELLPTIPFVPANIPDALIPQRITRSSTPVTYTSDDSPLTEMEDSSPSQSPSPSPSHVLNVIPRLSASVAFSTTLSSDSELEFNPSPRKLRRVVLSPSPERKPILTLPTPNREAVKMDCVLLPPLRSRTTKRHVQSDDSAPRKKTRIGPTRMTGSRAVLEGPVDHVGEDYGGSLVIALARANADPPRFGPAIPGKAFSRSRNKEPNLSRPPSARSKPGPTSAKKSSRPRITSPEPEKTISSLQNNASFVASSRMGVRALPPSTAIRGRKGRPPGKPAGEPATSAQTTMKQQPESITDSAPAVEPVNSQGSSPILNLPEIAQVIDLTGTPFPKEMEEIQVEEPRSAADTEAILQVKDHIIRYQAQQINELRTQLADSEQQRLHLRSQCDQLSSQRDQNSRLEELTKLVQSMSASAGAAPSFDASTSSNAPPSAAPNPPSNPPPFNADLLINFFGAYAPQKPPGGQLVDPAPPVPSQQVRSEILPNLNGGLAIVQSFYPTQDGILSKQSAPPTPNNFQQRNPYMSGRGRGRFPPNHNSNRRPYDQNNFRGDRSRQPNSWNRGAARNSESQGYGRGPRYNAGNWVGEGSHMMPPPPYPPSHTRTFPHQPNHPSELPNDHSGPSDKPTQRVNDDPEGSGVEGGRGHEATASSPSQPSASSSRNSADNSVSPDRLRSVSRAPSVAPSEGYWEDAYERDDDSSIR